MLKCPISLIQGEFCLREQISTDDHIIPVTQRRRSLKNRPRRKQFSLEIDLIMNSSWRLKVVMNFFRLQNGIFSWQQYREFYSQLWFALPMHWYCLGFTGTHLFNVWPTTSLLCLHSVIFSLGSSQFPSGSFDHWQELQDHPFGKAADCIYVFSVGTSTYSLCAVSLERYIGVIFPLR